VGNGRSRSDALDESARRKQGLRTRTTGTVTLSLQRLVERQSTNRGSARKNAATTPTISTTPTTADAGSPCATSGALISASSSETWDRVQRRRTPWIASITTDIMSQATADGPARLNKPETDVGGAIKRSHPMRGMDDLARHAHEPDLQAKKRRTAVVRCVTLHRFDPQGAAYVHIDGGGDGYSLRCDLPASA
jgi:hypothetical protein